MKIKHGSSYTEIRLLNNMNLVPADLDCMVACKPALEQIKTTYIKQKTCDDLDIAYKTFYNCYLRERRISAPAVSGNYERPDDFFLTKTPTDIVVLTCYLHERYHYSMNTEEGNNSVLFSDCTTKGKYSGRAPLAHPLFSAPLLLVHLLGGPFYLFYLNKPVLLSAPPPIAHLLGVPKGVR